MLFLRPQARSREGSKGVPALRHWAARVRGLRGSFRGPAPGREQPEKALSSCPRGFVPSSPPTKSTIDEDADRAPELRTPAYQR